MNTIELKKTKSDERTPLEIFEAAEYGQPFRIVGNSGETIGIKCSVNGVYSLVDLKDGLAFHDNGDTDTELTRGKLHITPINIKITEL